MNAGLKGLAVVVGEWTTEGTHPMVPGRTLHGRAKFQWIEDGAFLIVHTHIEDPQFPDGVAVFGTDDGRPDRGRMLYFDSRAVSREYEWTLAGSKWTWSRQDPKLSQRMHLTIAADGRTIECKGEMSHDGGPWAADLSLTYTRTG